MTRSPELDAGITRDIYGMPAFVTLETFDVLAAAAWFTGALDFIELFRMPPGDDPALVHLRRWRYQDVLVRRGVEAPAGRSIQLSFAAEYDELGALAQRARDYGADQVVGPVDTAWNTTDLTLLSPQGLRIVLTARRPEPLRDEAFSADMRR